MKRILLLFLSILCISGAAWADGSGGVPFFGYLDWDDVEDTPTTLSDYGITDGFAINGLPANTTTTGINDYTMPIDNAGTSYKMTWAHIVDAMTASLTGVWQPIDAILTSLSALEDGSGVLTNDGSGNLSWGAGGAGDVTSVLDDDTGAVPALIQSATAFSFNDSTPSVTGHSVFITANSATPTTITDFDDGTAGQILLVIINDASTTFDFTASGLEGMPYDYLATTGDMLMFVYASQDSQWHYAGPSLDPDLTDLADGSLTGSKVSDAAADGSTKGVATFTAAHFDAASGVISLDTTNGPDLFLDNCSLSPTGGTWDLSAVTLTMPAWTTAKTTGVAGYRLLYEANSTDTDGIGEMGPASVTESFYYQHPDAQPAANSIMLRAAPAGTGGPSSSKVSAVTFATLDDTGGDGDTAKIWTADKCFDQLALKQDTHASLTSIAAMTETTGGIVYTTDDNTYAILAQGSNDGYVLAINTTTHAPYWKADSTGAGGDQLVDIVATAPLQVNGTTNVNDALPGSDSDITWSIADDGIDSQHYAAGSIDNEHLADDAADSDEIASGAIDLDHMSAESVDSDQYVDGSIDAIHLAADIIDETKIADNGIDSEHYNDNSIDAEHLSDMYAYELIPMAWTTGGITAPGDLDDSTNGPWETRAFAYDADNDVNCVWQVPSDATVGGSVNNFWFRVHYLLTSDAVAEEGVAFGLSGASMGNSDAVNATKGTIVVVTDVLTADDDDTEYMVTAWSGVVAITNAAAGEMAEINLVRDIDDAADTYAHTAAVAFIEIRYVKNPAR